MLFFYLQIKTFFDFLFALIFLILGLPFFIIIMIEYYIEVPGTNIKESVSGFAYDTLYDMAQQYGIAELVWYALNGTRVVEGVYTDQD